ncbi:MAG: tetratricopeptide repeat protein, partial [Chlorobium limicola]|nr:tetratricopeptide repeat protein [Chlorobium limicola]
MKTRILPFFLFFFVFVLPVVSAADDFDALFVQAGMKYRKGDFQGASALYTAVLSGNPRSAEAYNNRGLCKAASGDVTGAVADYSEALKLDPSLAAA